MAAALALAALLPACSKSSKASAPPAELPVGPHIGPNGGRLPGPGGSELIVPAGALAADVALDVSLADSTAPALPGTLDVAALGAPFAFTPHGTRFAVPATVRVPFEPSALTTGAGLVLLKAEEGGEYVPVPATVDGAFLVAQVNDLSTLVAAASYPFVEYAYVSFASAGYGSIGAYTVSPADGTLSEIVRVDTGGSAGTVAGWDLDRSGRFMFLSSYIPGTVRRELKAFTLGADGIPVLNGAPIPTSASHPRVTPSGRALIATAPRTERYLVDPDGMIATAPAPSYPSDTALGAVFTPDGRHLYVKELDWKQYAADPDGLLTPLSAEFVPTVGASYENDLVVSPDGRSAYASVCGYQEVNGASYYPCEVAQLAVGAGGALTPRSPPTVPAGNMGQVLAIDPLGRSLYALNSQDGTISQYAIRADGTLQPFTPATVTLGAMGRNYLPAMQVDPSGRHLYVSEPTTATIWVHAIGAGGLLGPARDSGVVTPAGAGIWNGVRFAKKMIVPGGTHPVPHLAAWLYTSSSATAGPATPGVTPPGGASPPRGPFTLGVALGPWGGHITSSPGAIDLADTPGSNVTSDVFPAGTVVTLCAQIPNGPPVFRPSWIGDCSGTGRCTTVRMNTTKGCTLDLLPVPPY
jgi:hypothetical protein